MNKGSEYHKAAGSAKAFVSGDFSESRRFHKMLVGGAVLSSLTLISSLFVYYRPFTAEDLTRSIHTVSENISQLFHREAEASGQEVPETVPYLVSSQELGEISDLDIDTYDSGDSVYSVMLDTSLGAMLYYNQGDSRWAEYPYGGADPMKKYGCGPTAVAMLVNSFTNERVTPVDIANWSAENGCYASQGGSYHRLIPNALSAYGFNVESVTDYSRGNISGLLHSNHILVALMGRGALTNNGHFVIITKILDSGNLQIADPNNYENSTKEWNLEQIMSELKRGCDSGGPLWAVSLPQG